MWGPVKKLRLPSVLLVVLTTVASLGCAMDDTEPSTPIAPYITPIVALEHAVLGLDNPPADAPRANVVAPAPVVLVAPRPKAKPFFDKTTKIELAVSGAALAADAFTTVRNEQWPEQNPLLGKWPSHGHVAGYFAAAYAGEIGGMYLMRRHSWIKRTIPLAVT